MLFAWSLAVLAGTAHATATIVHELVVRLDPTTRRLEASDRLVLPAGDAVELALAERFRVAEIVSDGLPLPVEGTIAGGARRWRIAAAGGPREVALRWSGTLEPLPDDLRHGDTLRRVAPTGDPRGTFLPAAGRWYPSVAGMLERYRLRLELPAGQRGLVAGTLLAEREEAGRRIAEFAFDEPGEGIDLMAGPYQVAERAGRSIDGRPLRLATYLHPEVAAVAGEYLDAVAGYIARYERIIGPYPFDGFSVVSSPTPTGFGMPTLTYLGVAVIRMPFIRGTSLGHEVLHNWWGNGVYPDYAGGNWAEGLTTFMADYAYKEDEGETAAREMRLAWLTDFAAVPPAEDMPLARFTARRHGASQIVGYNKAAMVFLMLRDLLGSEPFARGLARFWRDNRFRVAGWAELRRAFEAEAARDLEPFFSQWLARPGAPALAIDSARFAAGTLRVVLRQAAPAYRVRVVLAVETGSGVEHHHAELDGERQQVELRPAARPVAVSLDPELRLMRRLAAGEAPPTLRQVMLDAGTQLLVLSPELLPAARGLAERMLEHPPQPAPPGGQPGPAPMLVVGRADEVDRWLAANALPRRPPHLAGHGSAQVWAAERAGHALVVVSAQDAPAVAALARPLPHYGRQSWIVFEGSRAGARGVWPGRPPRMPVE